MAFDLDQLFVKSDLIPVIIQEADTGEVLMLGFTNREAVELTLKTHTAWFWSRSRRELWNKGGTSGHYLHVKRMATDCDTDTLLYFLQAGRSHLPYGQPLLLLQHDLGGNDMNDSVLQELYQVVLGRKSTPREGSYTCYLFDKGLDKILKKVGEECSETIIAAKNGRQEETVGEISDLIYHLMVMMAQQNIPLEAVLEELSRRSQKIGNLKQMKSVDRET